MARKNLSQTDASEFERYSLDYILEKDKKDKDDTRYLSVEEALNDNSVYKASSNRNATRVLFISCDESLLNPSQQSLDGYTNISDLFDEVHILILRQGIRSKNPALRVANNVWLYTASAKDWWRTPFAGIKIASEQLVFAGGFRPDIIVARDPYESAVLAIMLGKKYERPVQVHVLEDYSKPEFIKKDKHNRWRKHLLKYTIPRIKSVRTSTRAIQDIVNREFSIKDISVLPRFNNYESLISIPPTLDLRQKYRPLVFIMLYVGKLNHDSYINKAIDAGRFGLRNPHIGLIVIGDGLYKKEAKKRAEIFGIKEQVIFEGDVKDIIPYLKSANVLIVPEVSAESEELVLQGAASGIPLVISKTPFREDIFVDGESALFCSSDNVDEFSLKLNMLMNDTLLRKHLVESAQEMIRYKFHDDPNRYRMAYRTSVEQAFFEVGKKDNE